MENFNGLREVYQSILMENLTEKEVINRISSQITSMLGTQNKPLFNTLNGIIPILGYNRNLVYEAKNNLEKRGGFPLVGGSKYTPEHIALILNEINEIKKL